MKRFNSGEVDELNLVKLRQNPVNLCSTSSLTELNVKRDVKTSLKTRVSFFLEKFQKINVSAFDRFSEVRTTSMTFWCNEEVCKTLKVTF
jgi:hypothetical protein